MLSSLEGPAGLAVHTHLQWRPMTKSSDCRIFSSSFYLLRSVLPLMARKMNLIPSLRSYKRNFLLCSVFPLNFFLWWHAKNDRGSFASQLKTIKFGGGEGSWPTDKGFLLAPAKLERIRRPIFFRTAGGADGGLWRKRPTANFLEPIKGSQKVPKSCSCTLLIRLRLTERS